MKKILLFVIIIVGIRQQTAAQSCTQASQASGGNCGSIGGTTAINLQSITGTITYIKDVQSFDNYTVNTGAEIVICNGGKLDVRNMNMNGGAIYIHSGGSLTIANLNGSAKTITNYGTFTCAAGINTSGSDNYFNAGIFYCGGLVIQGSGVFFTNTSSGVLSLTDHHLHINTGGLVNNGQILDVNDMVINSGGICLDNGSVIETVNFNNNSLNSVVVNSGTAGLIIQQNANNNQQVTNTANTLNVAVGNGCGNNFGTASVSCNTTTLPAFPASSTVFYSKATGSLNDVTNWGDQPDGSGNNPVDFTSASKVYIITNRSAANISANWTVSGEGTVVSVGDNTSAVTVNIDNADFIFNGAQAIITANSIVNVAATRTVTFGPGASLWITSNSEGEGAIGVVDGNVNGLDAGNVIMNKYIPGFASRVWSFVASPLSAGTIGDNWQQQIHITGPVSTGGATCTNSATTSQATPNSNNGLDPTPSGNYSMYYFDQSVAPNTSGQWKPITNTISTSTPAFQLNRGSGFRVLARGPRDQGCYLVGTTSTSTTPPRQAVMLRSFGSVPDISGGASSTLSYSTSNGNLYVMIGNPFICTFDFNAFQSDISNSSIINNKFWLYSPEFAAGAYSAYASGVLTNRPSNYAGDGSQDALLGSWQAFILELATAGSGSLTFKQSYKYTATPFTGSFKTTASAIPDLLRVSLKRTNDDPLDEIAIRFVSDPNVSNTNYSAYDALSLSGSANQFVQTIKDTLKLSIHARVAPFTSDTVALKVGSYISGTFKLVADGLGSFTNTDIFLLDRYNTITQNLGTDPDYSFTIDLANTSTYGINRFALVFNKQPVAAITPAAARFVAYPSPVSHKLNLELPGLNEEYKINLVNTAGRIVYSDNLRSGLNSIDISAAATGLYLLTITDTKANATVLKITKIN